MILSLVIIFCQNNNQHWSIRKDTGNYIAVAEHFLSSSKRTFFWNNCSKPHSIYVCYDWLDTTFHMHITALIGTLYANVFYFSIHMSSSQFSAHFSSFWCWRRCRVSSVLVSLGSSCMPLTLWLLRTLWRSAFPSCGSGKLGWRVKVWESIW